MDDLVDTTEMYLKAVIELEEDGIVPLRARISERLEQSGPTVSQTVGRMERNGLVVVSDDRHLELTPNGRQKAVHVMRKHRLAERFLDDVVGLEWEYVHEEACRWEHVMSEQVERKLFEVLGRPSRSPYGNLIPGLEEIGGSPAMADQSAVNAIRAVADQDAPVTAVIRSIGEPVQVDPALLRRLSRAGILPGNTGAFTRHGPGVMVNIDGVGEETELPHDIAVHIFVSV